MTDPAKYTVVGHGEMTILSPISSEKLDDAIAALELDARARLLDLGCGKGELVKRVSRRFGCEAVGVDHSPALVEAAATAQVQLSDGARALDTSTSWDAIACVGATGIFGGARETLAAVAPRLARGGRVLLGEGYFRREPAPAYLTSFGLRRDELGTLAELVALGSAHDLVPVHVAVASEDDFDRYEWSHARALERFARESPSDPDAKAFLARSRAWREGYLRWGRETLGFALVIWRSMPGHETPRR